MRKRKLFFEIAEICYFAILTFVLIVLKTKFSDISNSIWSDLAFSGILVSGQLIFSAKMKNPIVQTVAVVLSSACFCYFFPEYAVLILPVAAMFVLNKLSTGETATGKIAFYVMLSYNVGILIYIICDFIKQISNRNTVRFSELGADGIFYKIAFVAVVICHFLLYRYSFNFAKKQKKKNDKKKTVEDTRIHTCFLISVITAVTVFVYSLFVFETPFSGAVLIVYSGEIIAAAVFGLPIAKEKFEELCNGFKMQ